MKLAFESCGHPAWNRTKWRKYFDEIDPCYDDHFSPDGLATRPGKLIAYRIEETPGLGGGCGVVRSIADAGIRPSTRPEPA